MVINKKEIMETYARHEGDTRLSRGADRAAHRPHQPPQRAPQGAQEGPPQPSRLLLMVGQRRGLLDYLKSTDIEAYRALIAKLGLRK